MSPRARQIAKDLGKAAATHGPWGVLIALLLYNPEILFAAANRLNPPDSFPHKPTIEAAVLAAVTVADQHAEAIAARQVQQLNARLDPMANDVRETREDVKDLNRQIGLLLGRTEHRGDRP